jgi:hypothetical protein
MQVGFYRPATMAFLLHDCDSTMQADSSLLFIPKLPLGNAVRQPVYYLVATSEAMTYKACRVNSSSPSDQRRLPAPEVCRTRYLGALFGFSDCLSESPNACIYSLKFHDGFLCRHPDRRKFELSEQHTS